MAQHDASDAHSLFAAIAGDIALSCTVCADALTWLRRAGPWLAGTILGTGLTGCISALLFPYSWRTT